MHDDNFKSMLCFPEYLRIFDEHPELQEDTAKMLVYDDVSKVDLKEIKNTFNQFMIKDYVKSVKGTDFPKCISSDIDEDEFNRLIKKFLEYRGELYTGGICIKEYLDLKLYGDKTNEYRVFYMNHQIATVSRNSGQPCYTPEPPKEFIEKYRNLPYIGVLKREIYYMMLFKIC